MTTKNRWKMWPRCASTVAIMAGAAIAGNYDPTNQAGQYQTVRPAVLVKGAGGSFAPSTVWIPFIEPGDRGLLNGSQVEVVNGNPVALLTVFGANAGVQRQLTLMSTTDAASTLTSAESNNQILVENATNTLSDSPGTILPDGTIVLYERFGTGAGVGQNNIGFFNNAPALGVVPVAIAPFQVLIETAVNVGNAAETGINPTTPTVIGSVFIGSPSATRDENVAAPVNDNDLITAVTHFNGAPAAAMGVFSAAVNGVCAYRGAGNSPVSGTPNNTNGTFGGGHAATWLQTGVPLPTNPAGETAGDARQTQPVVATVDLPAGGTAVYIAHGIGFSGGSPFSGGSAEVLFIAVDTITTAGGAPRMNFEGADPTLANNTILIEADAAGGEGTQHGGAYDSTMPLAMGAADHFNTDPNLKFIDKQATGANPNTAGTATQSQFDMNRKGQIAAVWVNNGVVPNRYEARVYDPIWNPLGTRIEGYTLAKVITFNGDLGNDMLPIIPADVVTTEETTPGTFQEVGVQPISGLSIDDEGRVAFTAITRVVREQLGDWDINPFTPDTRALVASETALFVWEPTTDTLHKILEGGEGGDVLTDAFPGDGAAGERSLTLGFFPTDNFLNSDIFGRDGFSRSGGVLALNFRASGTQYTAGVPTNFATFPDGSPVPTAGPTSFLYTGGLLYDTVPANQFRINEQTARGVAMVKLGAFTGTFVCCVGN
ncbi:MAG TPA: hypothetical protein DEB06_10460, partial [Phycisphaerales bacterium]|nr:hypothetical protein [Phycisphaerales bacterium]